VEPVEVIILDEPSANLDHKGVCELQKMIAAWREDGKTILIAEHRISYLLPYITRAVLMDHGAIVREYPAEEFRSLSGDELHSMGMRADGMKDPADVTVRTDAKTGTPGVMTLSNMRYAYRHEKPVFDIPELDIPTGEIVAVTGTNGAGKSTFLRCLCGMERRCKATLKVGSEVWNNKSRRRKIYMVMQDVNHQLFTESVEDEVMLSMTGGDMSEDDKRERAREILDKLDLSKYYETHPMALSGGQKQRVAIASGIASEKPIIVFDEPTSGLDLFHMEQVADVIKDLIRIGKNVFVITHDYEFILKCCDHIIHLENGRVKDSFNLDDGSICKIKEFMCEMSEVS
jgi:energy-coupling factor transport system ATP-binding protein